jgi:hypothetical protein
VLNSVVKVEYVLETLICGHQPSIGLVGVQELGALEIDLTRFF